MVLKTILYNEWNSWDYSNCLFKNDTCFMRACWSIFCCMGSLDVEVTAVTGVVLLSAEADVELFSVEACVKSFEIVWGEFDSIVDGEFETFVDGEIDCGWGWPFGISP